MRFPDQASRHLLQAMEATEARLVLVSRSDLAQFVNWAEDLADQPQHQGQEVIDASAPAASAAHAIAGAIVRHALTAAGTALVAHGYVDQQTATNAIDPLADYVLGAALAFGAAGWSALHARLMHSRWVLAWKAPAKPLPPA